jgi:hypothetical protein
MSLINLTEAYLDSGRASLFEKIKFHFTLDLYHASSLYSLKGFSESPPRRTDHSYEQLSAYVILDSLELRLLEERDFERLSDSFLKFVNPYLNLPAFKIRDASGVRVALWGAGNASRFKEAKENMGLNKETFSLPSKMYLQYIHNDDVGFLTIKGFGNRIMQAKEKGFLEKLSEMAPMFIQPASQKA